MLTSDVLPVLPKDERRFSKRFRERYRQADRRADKDPCTYSGVRPAATVINNGAL